MRAARGGGGGGGCCCCSFSLSLALWLSLSPGYDAPARAPLSLARAPPAAPQKTSFKGQQRLHRLWRRRITAGRSELESTELEHNTAAKAASAGVDAADSAAEMASSPFRELEGVLMDNTSALWGGA